MDRVWSVQYLRGLAALGVVVFHALESTETKFEIGAAGVDIFFVISGFIMASLIMGGESTPGAFIWRRIGRIAPLYWATTVAALAVAWFKPTFFYRFDASLENALSSLAFLPHESTTGGVTPVLEQGWTLEYEMFFYALCTFALLLPATRRIITLCAALLFLATLGVVARPDNAVARVYTDPLLLEFLAGIMLAVAWRRGKFGRPGFGPVLLIAGFGILILQQAGIVAPLGARILDWGVPAMLIVAGALGMEASRQIVHSRTGLLLGDASYSLYLTHTFVVNAFVWVWADASLWIRVPACIAGSVLVSILVYLYFERPMTRMLNSLGVGPRLVGSR